MQKSLKLKFGLLSAVAVALGLVLLNTSASGASVLTHEPHVVRAHVDSIADFSDDRQLVGAVDNVFVGTVTAQLGTTMIDEDPETQFSVKVLENIKGTVGTTVVVNQFGGVAGDVLLLVGDDTLLKPGRSYLFATRVYAERGWHTLVPMYGDLPIDSATERATLVERFKKAVRYAIPYVPK